MTIQRDWRSVLLTVLVGVFGSNAAFAQDNDWFPKRLVATIPDCISDPDVNPNYADFLEGGPFGGPQPPDTTGRSCDSWVTDVLERPFIQDPQTLDDFEGNLDIDTVWVGIDTTWVYVGIGVRDLVSNEELLGFMMFEIDSDFDNRGDYLVFLTSGKKYNTDFNDTFGALKSTEAMEIYVDNDTGNDQVGNVRPDSADGAVSSMDGYETESWKSGQSPSDACVLRMENPRPNAPGEDWARLDFACRRSELGNPGLDGTFRVRGWTNKGANDRSNMYLHDKYTESSYGSPYRQDPAFSSANSYEIDNSPWFSGEILGMVGDYVWHDDNRNGIPDGGESPFANIPVRLVDTDADPDTVYAVDTTDASGLYLFTQVPAGDWLVDVNTAALPSPGGWFSTNMLPHALSLSNGQTYLDADFGFDTTASAVEGVLGDLVWYDHNSDQIQDDVNKPLADGGTEFGLPFVEVRLFNGDCVGGAGDGPLVEKDTTNTWGYYVFGPLAAPASYCVEVDRTTGVQSVQDFIVPILTKGFAAQGPTTPMAVTGSVPGGGSNMDYDFGFDLAVLPVELVSFRATAQGSSVELAWTTAAETENLGFEVQHTAAGSSQFEVIDFVEGAGTTKSERTYSYTIDELGFGRHLFRLRQVDFDGTFEFSPVVELSITELPGSFVLEPVFPNPFNPSATVGFGTSVDQDVEIHLFDALGRSVAKLYSGRPESGQLYHVGIDGTSLPSGVYHVVMTGGGQRAAQSVLLLK